jgi:hypothetical protein
LSHLTNTEAAIIAAAQASEACTELLRYAREGAVNERRSFDNEPIEKLAEALKLAIEIELGDEPVGIDDRAKLNELHGVLTDFIEGWGG